MISSTITKSDDATRAWQREERIKVQDVESYYSAELKRGAKNKRRRSAAVKSFAKFCKTYGGDTFELKWSSSHLRAIDLIEYAVSHGDMFAFAVPRGSGKTTLSWWGVLWAVLNGKSPYAMLISSTAGHAEQLLQNIKMALRENELLFEDYPEVCCPVRHLEGEARKASGQRYKGKHTKIEWRQQRIVFPTIPKSKSSGAIIDVTGISGESIRGRQVYYGGKVVRPTLAILDDPQT